MEQQQSRNDLLLQNGYNGLRVANVQRYILPKLCFDRYVQLRLQSP